MEFVIGKLNWPKMDDVCSDVVCSCGADFHHCCHRKGSGRLFRCPSCNGVQIFEDEVRLLLGEIHPGKAFSPHSLGSEKDVSFIQWKGTNVDMTVSCLCGHSFPVQGDFAYHADCPECKRHYHVDWFVRSRAASSDEIAQAEAVHDCELDEDFN